MDSIEIIIFTLENKVTFIPSKRCFITEGGSVVPLTENSSSFLSLLLKGVTDKEEIINNVWAKQRGSVTDSSYYGQIYLLRQSFRQVELPGLLIKTIPRKGVEYIGHVVRKKSDTPLLPTPIVIASENIFDTPVETSMPVTTQNSTIEKKDYRNHMHVTFSSRSWRLLVSILAVMAVCWLTTLCFVVITLM